MTPKRIVSDGFSKGRPPILWRHRCEECRVIFACWPCPHHAPNSKGVLIRPRDLRRLCEACKAKPVDTEPADRVHTIRGNTVFGRISHGRKFR